MTSLYSLAHLRDLPAATWDALVPTAQPFLRHAFLRSLEDSASVTPRTLTRLFTIALFAAWAPIAAAQDKPPETGKTDEPAQRGCCLQPDGKVGNRLLHRVIGIQLAQLIDGRAPVTADAESGRAYSDETGVAHEQRHIAWRGADKMETEG